jgi:prepilin-type N-terminal cleavage/methylation domain-containing protein
MINSSHSLCSIGSFGVQSRPAGIPCLGNDLKKGHAFTLVELMVAMTVTSLILGAAFSALFAGLKSYTTCAYETDVLAVMQRSLDRIFEDVSGCYLKGKGTRFLVVSEILETDNFGDIPMDSLLVTSNVGKMDWGRKLQSDMAEVEYKVDNDPETPARWLIRRLDNPADSNLKDGGEIHLVGPNVVGIQIEAFDGKSWLEEWDSETEYPQALRITLFMLPSPTYGRPKKVESFRSTTWIPRSSQNMESASGQVQDATGE